MNSMARRTTSAGARAAIPASRRLALVISLALAGLSGCVTVEPFAGAPLGWERAPADYRELVAMLAEGMDPDARFGDGSTLFHWVLSDAGFRYYRAESAIALLEAGATPTGLDARGGNLLGLLLRDAVHLGDEWMARLVGLSDPNAPGPDGRGPLSRCAELVMADYPGDAWQPVFRTLLAAGADPNATAKGEEPLALVMARNLASGGNGAALLPLLLESGTDFTATGRDGLSAGELFHSAPEAALARAVELVEDRLATPPGFDTGLFLRDSFRLPHEQRLLMMALLEGNAARVSAMATRGVTLDLSGSAAVRALHFGSAEAVSYLCAQGLSPDALMADDPTPAWRRDSAYRAGTAYARLIALLRAGAGLEPENRYARPALPSGLDPDSARVWRLLAYLEPSAVLILEAARSGRWEELAGYAAAGIRPTPRDPDGLDPISLAIDAGASPGLIAALAASGLDADSRDRSGVSPLMRAAAAGAGESALAALIAAGARAAGRDLAGRTAADHARAAGKPVPAALGPAIAATPGQSARLAGRLLADLAPAVGGEAPALRLRSPYTGRPASMDIPAERFEVAGRFFPMEGDLQLKAREHADRAYWVTGDRLWFIDAEYRTGAALLRSYRILPNLELEEHGALALPDHLGRAIPYRDGALFVWAEDGEGSPRTRLTALDLGDPRGASLALTVRPEALPVSPVLREAVSGWFRSCLLALGGDPSDALRAALSIAAAVERAGGLSAVEADSLRFFPGLALLREAGREDGSWLAVDALTGESKRLWPGSPSWPPSALMAGDAPAVLALPGSRRAVVFRAGSASFMVVDLSSPFEPRLIATGRRPVADAGGGRWVGLDAGAFAWVGPDGRLVAYELSGGDAPAVAAME